MIRVSTPCLDNKTQDLKLAYIFGCKNDTHKNTPSHSSSNEHSTFI